MKGRRKVKQVRGRKGKRGNREYMLGMIKWCVFPLWIGTLSHGHVASEDPINQKVIKDYFVLSPVTH